MLVQMVKRLLLDMMMVYHKHLIGDDQGNGYQSGLKVKITVSIHLGLVIEEQVQKKVFFEF